MLSKETCLAAIDVGSNAIRMVVGKPAVRRKIQIIESFREPIRLGEDSFRLGEITPATSDRLLAAFQNFRTVLDRYHSPRYRAVATSALREASNRNGIRERIAQTTGIELEIIDEEEEARLVHLAVSDRVHLNKIVALLVDIGGGSVEVILSDHGNILAVESFKLGSVRLLQLLDTENRTESEFIQLVREHTLISKKWMKRELGKKKVEIVIGTGGNIEALSDVKRYLNSVSRKDWLSERDLINFTNRMVKLTLAERVTQFKLRPDRVDVIIPAAIVLQSMFKHSGAKAIYVPKTGLKEGILLDMLESSSLRKIENRHEQTVAQAIQVGRRFNFDEQHAKTVSAFAVRLFDATFILHKLTPNYRLMLEIGAIVHDIGQFIHPWSHHKTFPYIVQSTPLVGISEYERVLIGNIARYHRKSFPTLAHDSYRALTEEDRIAATKLASLLRLADALDCEHELKVQDIRIELKRQSLQILLVGDGDLLLEKWAVAKKASMFELSFSLSIIIQNEVKS